MDNRKTIGSLIAVAGILIALFTLGRALYWGPGPEDAGIQAPNAEAEAMVAGAISAEESRAKPTLIHIPKIGVRADIQHLGITSSGLMAVPSNYTDTGWYKYGPAPGMRGSSVIAGHQDNGLGTPAIFYELEKLSVGDDIYVENADGERLHFKVRKIEVVPYNLKGPKLEEIFNNTGGRYLNLITCAGSWVDAIRTNNERLIVYTELVSS